MRVIPNSANEAKSVECALACLERLVKVACVDRQADDCGLYRRRKDHYDIQLLTRMRRTKIKSPERHQR